MNNWFEVSTDGLRKLQAGKPKCFVVRELIQNAFDEDITRCNILIEKKGREIRIVVEDDNPEGFQDLRDAYTLFKETAKRKDPEKGGIFTFGEKQALSIATEGRIKTTKGEVIFTKRGRKKTRNKTEVGSLVEIKLNGTQKELSEIIDFAKSCIPPRQVKYIINGEKIGNRAPIKSPKVSLTTVIAGEDGIIRRTKRLTEVWIYENNKDEAKIFELGIPIQKIDGKFDVDIRQRVPLSMDRDMVPDWYLRDIRAEVLNATVDLINEDETSDIWIRDALADNRMKPEVVKKIVEKRYGEKVCVAAVGDGNSVDEALAKGYRVVRGAELSKEEWVNIKKAGCIKSSQQLFGRNSADDIEYIEEDQWTTSQKEVSLLAKKIARRLLGFELEVKLAKSWSIKYSADFGSEAITFYVNRLDEEFWGINKRSINLIIHELGHIKGHHTEKEYHSALTSMAGALVMIALTEPEWILKKEV